MASWYTSSVSARTRTLARNGSLNLELFGTVGILGHRMSPGGSGEERSATRLRTGRCSMTGYRPTTTLAVVRRVRVMAREFRVKEPPAGPPTRAPHNVLLWRKRVLQGSARWPRPRAFLSVRGLAYSLMA